MSKGKITSLLDFVQEQNKKGKHINWLDQRALNLLKAKDGGNKFLDFSKVDLMTVKGIAGKEKVDVVKTSMINHMQSIIDIANKCDMSVEEVVDEIESLKEEEKSE